MTISVRLKNFLDQGHVNYHELTHPETSSTQEVAESEQIQANQIAKAVIIKSEDHYLMCVLPSICYVDFEKLSKILKTRSLELAEESEITKLFPFYEMGAEPPFSDDSGIEVYVDESFNQDDEIYFNAGTHEDMVEMNFKDYIRLAKPKLGDFTRKLI